MSEKPCPVNDSITALQDYIKTGRFKHPKNRLMADEVLDLLEDLAWGRGSREHVPAIDSLLKKMKTYAVDDKAESAAQMLLSTLSKNMEVFESHAQTHICKNGACIKLAPAPCQMACPAGIDIPTYITLIGMGKDAQAIEIIRRDNPFPWVCGLVCTRPCEFMCVRARIDTPVSIKFLKAFAAERAMSQGKYLNPPKADPVNKRVCVIGAGPGGMSCAYYLALKGYEILVIEKLPSAGGMTLIGIPRYRLPREVIDREVAMLEDLGVKFMFNTVFGQDISMEKLKKQGFEAFFFAIGAHRAYNLGIPGEKELGAVEAIDLLKQVALGQRHKPGERVIVVGGGNVAIDAARTCLRLGCRDVTIAYRRTRDEMPADIEEVEQAEEEGIRFSFLTVPLEIIGKSGKAQGLRSLRAELVKIEGSTRMSPVPVEGSEFIMDADVIITAIGQQVESSCMKEIPGLKWTRRSTIDVNMVSMETSVPGIFAAGDAVTGPATVIEAIGGGKKAAESIHRYLSGIPQPKMPPVPVRRSREKCLEVPSSTKMVLKKPEMPLLNIDRRRTTFQQVELGYSENAVREEARRCLRCDICRRCGECVEICRDKMEVNALEMGYFDFDHPVKTDFRKTQDTCITCGACANNCPNEAMKIKDSQGERILSLCGTVLNRQKILNCEICGNSVGPRRYLDFIKKSMGPIPEKTDNRIICGTCLRNKGAADTVEIKP